MTRSITAILCSISITAGLIATADATDTAALAQAKSPTLSKKEISELKAHWTDPETKRSYRLEATFTQESPAPETVDKYRKSGAIPYRITASLFETREVAGKQIERLLTGDKVRLCILDGEDNPVLDIVQSLATMCPS